MFANFMPETGTLATVLALGVSQDFLLNLGLLFFSGFGVLLKVTHSIGVELCLSLHVLHLRSMGHVLGTRSIELIKGCTLHKSPRS